MRAIDADALEPDTDYDDGECWAVSMAQIQNAPTIEPEIIHCKDCKHSMNNENSELWICAHPNNNAWRITPDHYCGYAERRTDDANDIT